MDAKDTPQCLLGSRQLVFQGVAKKTLTRVPFRVNLSLQVLLALWCSLGILQQHNLE